MRTQARLAVWIVVMVLLALGLTGCFRSVGDDLEPTAQGVIPQPGGTVTTQPEPTTDAAAQDLEPTAEQMTQPPTPIGTAADGTPSLTPFPTFAGATRTPFPTPTGGQGGPFVAPPTATPTGVIATTVEPAAAAQPTYTPPPTNTPLPTEGAQVTYTPLPTYTPFPTSTSYPTNTPLPTYTQQPSQTARPTRTPLPPAVGPTRTFTPVPFRTFPASPTYTPYAGSVLAGVQSVAVLPTNTPIAQPPVATSTIVAPGEAAPLAERQPGAVEATPFGGAAPAATPTSADVPQGGGTPPLTEPTPAATEVAMVQATPLSPGQLTATMIVYEATATSAALTGTPLPTWTPSGVDGQGGPLATQPAVQQAIPPGQFPPNATVITATPFGQGGICDQHLIQLGETLFSIATRYGVTAEEIQQANPALIPTIDQITAGSTIDIPCPTPVTPTAQPVPVVTNVPDGQGGPITSGSGTTTTTVPRVHVVQLGDTLFSIARQYGVDIYDLIRANGYTTQTMNFITEGEEIIIPGQTVNATAVPAAGTTGTTGTNVTPSPTPYIVIVTPAGQ